MVIWLSSFFVDIFELVHCQCCAFSRNCVFFPRSEENIRHLYALKLKWKLSQPPWCVVIHIFIQVYSCIYAGTFKWQNNSLKVYLPTNMPFQQLMSSGSWAASGACGSAASYNVLHRSLGILMYWCIAHNVGFIHIYTGWNSTAPVLIC